jgi:hypothetical protein
MRKGHTGLKIVLKYILINIATENDNKTVSSLLSALHTYTEPAYSL